MTGAPRSKLLPLGVALMIAGMAFSRGLAALAQDLNEGTYRRIVLILADALSLCIILGLVLGIAGFVRNRRAMKRYVRGGPGTDDGS